MSPSTTERAVSRTPEFDAAPESPGLAELVHRLGAIVSESLPRGDVAELRRLDPSSPFPAAFWKLVVGELEPLGALTGEGPRREEQERRWAVVLNVQAHLGNLNEPGRTYGHSLAGSGFSEHRFGRLLRARGEILWDQARRSGQFLAAQGQATDVTSLAWLILSEGRTDAQRARRHLARDYYRALPTTEGD